MKRIWIVVMVGLAIVDVLAVVRVSIDPEVVSLDLWQQRHFQERVTGLPSSQRTVDWSATCGDIRPAGLYTATEVGTCEVRATVRSTGDSATALVIVSAP